MSYVRTASPMPKKSWHDSFTKVKAKEVAGGWIRGNP